MKKYLSILLVSFLCACSGVKVLETEAADNTDLKQYKTFDFYKVDASGDTVTAMFDERIDLLKDAIAAALVQRGYTANSASPDLLVNIGVLVDEKIQTRTTDWRTDGAPRYVGQRNYSWKSQEVEVGRYREGTVTIHLVDAAKKKMVWKGAFQGTQKNIREGVTELFKRFPV